MPKYVDIEKAEFPYMSMSLRGVNSKDCKIYNEGVKAAEDMIQALPTADVVEVVRCKDCKYFTEGMAIGMCKRIASKPIIPCHFDHFCSCGERK